MKNKWMEWLRCAGADTVSLLRPAEIPFAPELRALCEQNACGNYGKCWTCPPLCGDVNALAAKVAAFKQGILFSKIYRLEDSFDVEGMRAGRLDFGQITRALQNAAAAEPGPVLVLSAGGCALCEICAARENLPCRHPDKALLSLEACGIEVSALAKQCGVKYINGANTVTYFGAIFWNEINGGSIGNV